jgi:putative ABC transport system permease protein
MLKNYLITALRNLFRNKITSFINILGLGLGIGVFVLILLFIAQEVKVDKFISDKDRIFRLEAGDWALMGPGMADFTKELCPEVEDAVSIRKYFLYNEMAKVEDKAIMVNDYLPVTNSFVNFFGFNVLQGNVDNPLNDPYDLVLTSSEAKRLFGDENPIGKVVTIYDKYNLTVRAVINDPTDFHLSFDALLSFDILPILYDWKDMSSMLFRNMNNPTYLKLKSPNQRDDVIFNITKFLKEKEKSDLPFDLNLRPVNDIYFKGAIPFEGDVKHGNLRFIHVMIVVAVLILFLACVNYINLSTARASTRAKEIGIRKAVGGRRISIIYQFLGESIIITITALIIGITFVELLTPFFSFLVERDLSTSSLIGAKSIIIILSSTVALGVLSGLYPALYLSDFTPAKVLKGQNVKGAKGGMFRKVLIVFQFSVSVALIISTLLIFSQLSYFANYDVGFNKEQIININIPRKTTYSYEVFKEKVLQVPSIEGISRSNSKMGSIGWQESYRDENGDTHNFSYHPVDPDYIDLLELEIVDGRKFEWDRPNDLREVIIINETLAEMIGMDNPIGHRLTGGFLETEIIGVIKDFNFNSLHSNVGPLALHYRGREYNTYNIKVDVEYLTETLTQLQQLWEEYSLEAPFEYSFLNESFENSYRSEQRMGQMFGYFSVIAIFIGCMGLFGLSAFMLQARVKEMGIRKVLGASTLRIIGLMGREFAILVVISNAIAWPIAFYAMLRWLQGFPYRTSISILFFIAALLISLAIAFITVAYHSWKTARSNPVDALKYE